MSVPNLIQIENRTCKSQVKCRNICMKGVTIKILHFIRKIREEENEKWSHIQAQVESIALQQTENSRMY